MSDSPFTPEPGDWLAGLDPGRSKCGLALARAGHAGVLAMAVLPPAECLARLGQWQRQGLKQVLLGNGTHSRRWHEQLNALGLEVRLVEERGTTLAARQRYWQLYPARGWRRLLPQGLRLPPRDVDDVVALLLLERQLGCRLSPVPGDQKRARTVKA